MMIDVYYTQIVYIMTEKTSLLKILLADDDEKFSEMVGMALTKAGFSVVHAKNGDEALQMMRREHPSLVLLDIMMPDKLGFEVLEEAKADPSIKDIPVATLSYLTQDSDIAKVKNLGAIDHIPKTSVSLRDIVDRTKKYLGI